MEMKDLRAKIEATMMGGWLDSLSSSSGRFPNTDDTTTLKINSKVVDQLMSLIEAEVLNGRMDTANTIINYLLESRTADNTADPDIFYATLSKKDLENIKELKNE